MTSHVPEPPEILPPPGPPRAVVLVAHGLNQRSHAMRPLFEALRERGALVVLLTLRGHRHDAEPHEDSLPAWRDIRWEHWQADWQRAAQHGADLAREHGVPLGFLGYSLGALVHTYGVAHAGDAAPIFERQVLLAPAIRIRTHSRVVRLFRLFGLRFLVPSLAPVALRSHHATSVAAFESMFRFENALSTLSAPEKLRIPTLVVIDPRDELTSATSLRRWIVRHGLAPAWRVVPIARDPATAAYRIRHYVTDPQGLGIPPFERLVELAAAALIDGVMPDDPPRA